VSEVQRLRNALNFLTSHLPGASELAEIAETPSYTLTTNHVENAEMELLETTTTQFSPRDHQEALDRFKEKRLNNLEVGRLYERYIGYLYEQDGYEVTFKGVVDGFDDLGRDLIARKGNEYKIIQAKCWSKKKTIHEKHVYQLYTSHLHWRMSFRKALQERYGKSEAKKRMKPISSALKAVMCTTTDLSETAMEVVKFTGMEHRLIPLEKNYPMIKCNINKNTGSKLYHLPFDPAYDTIIIGNVDGERYVETIKEAEDLGFSRAGH
jgi:hypothetical protein